MYEYDNNYLSSDSPRKGAEFNADNRSIYDVYGNDNYIYKKMRRSGNMYRTQDSLRISPMTVVCFST